MIVTILFNQSAIALECMLVLQVGYLSLLQSGFIYEGWAGMIMYGKYTFGVNLGSLIEANNDDFTTIGLTTPLLNVVNITAGLVLLPTLLILVMFLYEAIIYRINKNKEIDELADRGSAAKMTSRS